MWRRHKVCRSLVSHLHHARLAALHYFRDMRHTISSEQSSTIQLRSHAILLRSTEASFQSILMTSWHFDEIICLCASTIPVLRTEENQSIVLTIIRLFVWDDVLRAVSGQRLYLLNSKRLFLCDVFYFLLLIYKWGWPMLMEHSNVKKFSMWWKFQRRQGTVRKSSKADRSPSVFIDDGLYNGHQNVVHNRR